MGTRSFAQVAPTPGTIALNAYIFGYGGHSLVTPHAQLKQLWWTDERIEAKVTFNFILTKLRGEERGFLDRKPAWAEALGGGGVEEEDLTDETYATWILTRAKRLFLILTEIGEPDQIFGCIDDSWNDDDLPVPWEDVHRLELSYENDEALNRKFYDTQFLYLLRELEVGSHIDYGRKEHIPMEHVNTLPPAVSLQAWDRIHFPGRPDVIYMRRKYPLTDKSTGRDLQKSFMQDVRKAQALAHEHIAKVWASYTTEGAGYIVSDFVGEHTLGTFIDHRRPAQFQRVEPSQRPVVLCEWMHCLADALASLHHRGAVHSAIRPSNILIDHSNHIAFADVGSLRTFQRGKKVEKTEIYDYAAPESQQSQANLSLASSPPPSSMGAFSKLRKMSSSTSSSSTESSNGSGTRSNSISTAATGPMTPPPTTRSNSVTCLSATVSPTQKSSGSFRNFSRHLANSPKSNASTASSSPTTVIRIVPQAAASDADTIRDSSDAPAVPSDIYSLGCVFLDILTLMIKGKINDFVKLRTSRLTSPTSKTKRSRNDSSFHANLDKINDWVEMLQEDSERLTGQIYRGVPALLEVVRSMIVQDDMMRPPAIEVRNRIKEILVGECGVEKLCCEKREWESLPLPEASTASKTNIGRDSMSIAMGGPGWASRIESDCMRAASRGEDQVSVLSRTESNAVSTTSRRSSSGSAATTKVSPWRRAFSRQA